MFFLYFFKINLTRIFWVALWLRKTWLILLVLPAAVYAQHAWQHPLGLSHGDLTYDEWVIVNKKKKETNKAAILRQLSPYYEKDHWASYIAAELLLLENTDAARKESNRLTMLAARQGNPVAAAYMGLWFFRNGQPDQGKHLIETAAEAGHPRGLTIKAVVASVPEEERERLLKTAQAAGDEVASFILAQQYLMNKASGERTLSYFSQLRSVIEADSYLSASPLARSKRSANDSPHAIFYAAQTQYLSSKSLTRSELKSIESMLLEVSDRVKPRDQRSFWLFRENAALRAQIFLAGNIYRAGELRNVDKAEEQLVKASKMAEPIGSTHLAQEIYAPRSGLKPDPKKYINTLELAAKQGGPSETINLAREYLQGDYLPRSPRKVVELLEPFKGQISRFPDDLRVRYRLTMAEAMFELSPEDRLAASQDLKSIWEAFDDPEAASLLAAFFTNDRSNPQSEIQSDMWFGRAYDSYLKKARKAGARALALKAAGDALSRQDFSAYRTWKAKTLAVDSSNETKDIFTIGDFFVELNRGQVRDLSATISQLTAASARGSGFADAALGFLKFSLKEEQSALLSLESYQTYFERAVQRDGKVASQPLTSFLLQALGPSQQAEMISWLKKTSNFHGPEEEGVLQYLLYLSPNSSSSEKGKAIQEILRVAKAGGGFASGFVAAKRHAKDPAFASIGIDDVELLLTSINSSLPYPESFVLLADRLLSGDGVEKNIDSAKYLLKRGAESGSRAAMMKIARGSIDRTFGYVDHELALKFAKLADAYGEPEANDLVTNIELRIRRDEAERHAAQSNQIHLSQGASHAHSERSGSSFFAGLGSFLGTMLEIGLVVGLIVLAGAAAGPALSGLAMPSSTPPKVIYPPPARAAAYQPTAVPRTVPTVRSVGLPDYTSGRAVYTTNPLPVPMTYAQKLNVPSSVEIRGRSSLDPSTKLRGSVASDGSFTASNLVGGSVRGSFTKTPSGKVQVEIRPKNDWDPSNRYRGTLDTGGDLTLRNPITGQTIKGKYDWASEYGAR